MRCLIEELDKKSLIIRDVPYGVTVSQLCESITKANDAGKIKIKKLTEYTGKHYKHRCKFRYATEVLCQRHGKRRGDGARYQRHGQ